MAADDLSYIRKRLDYLCERVDEHIDRHADEGDSTATYRRETGERVRALETALQMRSAVGAAGLVLAALFQPVAAVLATLGGKHP